MTDHPEPCLFILSPSVTADGVLTLDAPDHISLHERIGRPAEFFTGLVVNASETIAVASVYTGKLRVLDFRIGDPNEGFDVKYVNIYLRSVMTLYRLCYSVPELNILSLCFVPSDEETPVVAILHRDYQQRVQLLSRELNIESFDLSVEPAVLLQPTLLSSTSFPQADTPPILVPVTATNTENKDVSEEFSGGVMVIGGKKMILHRLAPTDWQEKKKAKHKRESQRKGSNAADLAKAREKEAARRNMKRKPFCSVEWPFGEITGSVCARKIGVKVTSLTMPQVDSNR
jgi:DNA damage-binding protein 1